MAAWFIILFVWTSVWHSALGVQVVVEDYIRPKGSRVLVLVLVRFVHILIGAAALVSVLMLAFGGQA